MKTRPTEKSDRIREAAGWYRSITLSRRTYERIDELMVPQLNWPYALLDMVERWQEMKELKLPVRDGYRVSINDDAIHRLLALLYRDLISTWGKPELQPKFDRTLSAIVEVISQWHVAS